MPTNTSTNDVPALLAWYRKNRRDLPWRRSRDPYAIWLSETMLQQTTTTAVIPYFEKFMARYPRLKDLAAADEADVLALWAGLGYYSRARNLLRAARELAQLKEFPRRYEELLSYPGFGPYTARAVSSIAFDETVGVLDGNVIRVLSRRFDLEWPWWQTKFRSELQARADAMAQGGPPSEVNQALMELGSQICTPKTPHCVLCPWLQTCEARRKKTELARPMARPRRASEIWVWRAQVLLRGSKIKLVKNSSLPFLSSHWTLPGAARKEARAPKHFSFKHSVTHHNIFVKLNVSRTLERASSAKAVAAKEKQPAKWVALRELPRHAPSSVITKALKFVQSKNGLLVFALISSAMLLSCRATVPTNPNTSTLKTQLPPPPKVAGLHQLTTVGENYRPRVSPDGSHLLFLSEKRPNHLQPQIYELDLSNQSQRRITFQDGTVYDADYAGSNDTLIYSSDTDQIKENPIYIRQALEKYRPTKSEPGKNVTAIGPRGFTGDLPLTDIYIGGRDGRNIRRLTNTAGFDGEIATRREAKGASGPRHNEAVVVSERQGFLTLSMLNTNSGSMWPLIIEKNNDEWPALSPDGKHLLWMHIIGPSESEIWMGDARAGRPQKVLGAGVIFAWPQWLPSSTEIVFASNKDTMKNLELYVARSDGTCVRRLTSDGANKSEPVFSPDGKTIYFTSDRSGSRQIYSLDYTLPVTSPVTLPASSTPLAATSGQTDPCPAPSPSVK